MTPRISLIVHATPNQINNLISLSDRAFPRLGLHLFPSPFPPLLLSKFRLPSILYTWYLHRHLAAAVVPVVGRELVGLVASEAGKAVEALAHHSTPTTSTDASTSSPNNAHARRAWAGLRRGVLL